MIVIVDDNTERGLALRHSALSAFLPCAFCSVSEFVHFPHGKDIVVLCADVYKRQERKPPPGGGKALKNENSY